VGPGVGAEEAGKPGGAPEAVKRGGVSSTPRPGGASKPGGASRPGGRPGGASSPGGPSTPVAVSLEEEAVEGEAAGVDVAARPGGRLLGEGVPAPKVTGGVDVEESLCCCRCTGSACAFPMYGVCCCGWYMCWGCEGLPPYGY